MNWYVLASVFLYLGAAVDEYSKKNYPMTGAWICWATANAFLCYMSFKQ